MKYATLMAGAIILSTSAATQASPQGLCPPPGSDYVIATDTCHADAPKPTSLRWQFWTCRTGAFIRYGNNPSRSSGLGSQPEWFTITSVHQTDAVRGCKYLCEAGWYKYPKQPVWNCGPIWKPSVRTTTRRIT
ncbi:MAG: hypothetical protein COB66_07015 [Coxiella sp. (in: Bacteria)]|nr:MAG: hypothetical protein COB66_07015 [Coxiella sp. (in: g-proteobacteria)]